MKNLLLQSYSCSAFTHFYSKSIRLLLSLLLLLLNFAGCSEESFLDESFIPPRRPYSGLITVINRSQFTYTGFYLHPMRTPATFENLLEEPLERGDSLQVEVVPRLYFSASRPKVERGREWLIQTAAPVTFYGNQPVLLILDQSFMVIDPSVAVEADNGPPERLDQGSRDRNSPARGDFTLSRSDQSSLDQSFIDQGPFDHHLLDQRPLDQSFSDRALSDQRLDHGGSIVDLMQPEVGDQHQRGEGDGDSSPPLDRSPREDEGLIPGGGLEDAG